MYQFSKYRLSSLVKLMMQSNQKKAKMSEELEVLRDYIRKELGYEGNIDPEIDLLEAKILDSFNIVELAVFIQEQFQIELEPEDVVRANLSTLASMISLIKMRKTTEDG